MHTKSTQKEKVFIIPAHIKSALPRYISVDQTLLRLIRFYEKEKVALRQEGIAVSHTSKKIVSDQKIAQCIVFVIVIMDNITIAIHTRTYDEKELIK